MNRESNPCNEDPAYDFQLCVRKSFTRIVGCRLPWGLRSSEQVPLCRNIEQLGKFHSLYDKIYTKDMEYITNNTGCLNPCHYREYQLVKVREDTAKMFIGLYVQLTGSSQKQSRGHIALSHWCQILGDPWMGLFLGFSFIMLWQVIEAGIVRIKK